MVNVDRNMRDFLQIDPIIKKIKSIVNVDKVNFQGNLIKKIERYYQKIGYYLPYVSGFVILIMGLIIYNLIKVSIYARRDTIKSLRLIGATKLFIRLPLFLRVFLLVLFLFPLHFQH